MEEAYLFMDIPSIKRFGGMTKKMFRNSVYRSKMQVGVGDLYLPLFTLHNLIMCIIEL